MKRRLHLVPALLFVLIAAALAGCGGSDDSVSQADLDRATQQAAQQARQQERIKALEAQLDQPKGQPQPPVQGGAAPPAQGVAPAPNPTPGSSCGNGISVGPNTSCPFAQNVVAAFRQSGGADTISVYSPVTGRTYTMSCAAGTPNICTGGNNATVYFP